MTSLFSFLRSAESRPDSEAMPPASPAEAPAVASTVPAPPAAAPALPPRPAAPAMSPAPGNVLTVMLGELLSFVTPAGPPLPDPTVSVLSIVERPVGLGGLRGIEPFGPFSAVALKGGRFDTVVRFQLWGNDQGAVEAAVTTLHGDLLAARDTLWGRGFLKIVAEASLPAEHVAASDIWRNSVDYRLLYEYHYQESDAESLIAQIPVAMGSLLSSSTIITDDMVRWDNVSASELIVRLGRRRAFQLRELYLLSFLPAGWDGDGVTISATTNGATVEQVFPSVRAFQASFTPATETIQLGSHEYTAGRRAFPNPAFPEAIVLAGGDDALRITYATSAFDSDAVVYLRAMP